MNLDLIAVLSRIVRDSVQGNSWHGPSVNEALNRVNAAAASARPVSGAHSIWELALHIAAWMEETASRLEGVAHQDPEMGDFPVPRAPTEDEWQRTGDLIQRALDHLLTALSHFPPHRLGEIQDHGKTYAEVVAGLAQHNAYHAGQIVVLARALAEPRP